MMELTGMILFLLKAIGVTILGLVLIGLWILGGLMIKITLDEVVKQHEETEGEDE